MTTKRQRRTAASVEPEGGTLRYSWSRQFDPAGRGDINVYSTDTGTIEHIESLLQPADGDFPDVKTAPGYFCARCTSTESRKGKGSADRGMFYRDGDSITDQSVFGFDFDFGVRAEPGQPATMHPDALAYADIIRDALEEATCWWALYTTASHTEEWPRLRVVFATDRPAVGDDEMLLVRASLLDRFFRGIPVDSATFTPAQVMYRAPQGSEVEFSPNKNPMRLTAVLRHARQNEVKAPVAAKRRNMELTEADDLAAIFTPFMQSLLTLPGASADGNSVVMPASRSHGRLYSGDNHGSSLRFSPPGRGFGQFNVTFVHDTDKKATSGMKHTDKLKYACEAAGADFELLDTLTHSYHRARNSDDSVDSDDVTPASALSTEAGAPPKGSLLKPISLEPLPVLPLPGDEDIESFAKTLYEAPKEDDADGSTAAMLMDEARERARTILTHKWFQNCFVFVGNKSRVFDLTVPPNQVTELRLPDFKNLMAPFHYTTINGKGEPKEASYVDGWVKSQHRQSAHDTVFEPGEPRITEVAGVPMVNTFYVAPFKFTEEHDLMDEFLKIVDRTHPIPKERELFLDWLAFSFRYPQQKILWAYTNISEARGSGRGLLANAVRNLLGHNNVNGTGVKQVAKDDYHDYAHQALVSLLEEADSDETGKRIKVDGLWNDVITGEHKLLNLKYGGQVKANLYNNIMIFLNHYSLIIDKADRRIQAITGAPKDVQKLDTEWAGKYGRVFLSSKDFRDQLASALWVRDLSNFDYSHSDRTLPAREKLLNASDTPADELAAEIVESLPACVVDAKGLKRFVEMKCANQKLADPKIVYMVVRGKAIMMNHTVNLNGKAYKCYVFREPEDSYAAQLTIALKKLAGMAGA